MIKKLFKYIIFYLKNKNIKSIDISLKAKLGKDIKISKNTFIDSNCQIGSYTYIGKNCNISKSEIGRYCSIANNVSIGQGEHNLNKISTSSLFYSQSYQELTKEPCVIKNDVWIGTDAVILRGVEIGNGAVIGANSVVTKDIPPFAIAVGTPAKVVRFRFEGENIEKIINSKWFEYEIDEAKIIIKELEND